MLITNNTLSQRAGTELYVRDIATALRDRGHHPVAYSQTMGAVAEELAARGVSVIDDLELLAEPPDVIHAQHHLESMTAILRFPSTPAVFVCHGARPWEEAPPRSPRIRRYIAVDHASRDRLIVEHAIPAGEVEVLLNFVDLGQFPPRAPLPKRPRRALVFDNGVTEQAAAAAREACAAAGMTFDVAGLASGRVVTSPGTLLQKYDIVFARGRAALEAMATGTAVIVYGEGRIGPFVTAAQFDRLRVMNFGYRTFAQPVSPGAISAEIGRYNPADAAAVSARVRAEAGRDRAVDRLIAIYREAIAAQTSAPRDPEAEGRAAAAYLRWLSPRLKDRDHVAAERDYLRMEFDHWTLERAQFVADREWLKTELAEARRLRQRFAHWRRRLTRIRFRG